MYKLEARTYVNNDSTKVVDEGSPDAAFLLGAEGDEISVETAERLGLVSASTSDDAPKYDSMKKAEIVELADQRGVDSSGTIAQIAERLEEDDAKAKAAEVGAGGAGGTADQGAPEATAATGSPEATSSTSTPA